MSNDDTHTGGFAALKHRDFTLFLIAKLLTSLAGQMMVVAVGWQVYQMTGRLIDLGLIGLSQFLPFVLLILFAGHTADQYDRRSIIILCNVAHVVCAAMLFATTRYPQLGVVPIFVALAFLGTARAFHAPAAQAIMPNLVPVNAFGNAVALNSSTWQIATVAGPSIGGILYSVAEKSLRQNSGAALVYTAAGALLVAAVIMMSFTRARKVAPKKSPLSWSTLLEGLRFVWRRKTVLGAISLDLFAVLFGGASALLPAFTRDVLHEGPEIFGYLRSAPGVGAGITAVWLAFAPIERRVGQWMFIGVAVFGVATIVFALTNRFWIALLALAVLGAGDMVSVFIRHILVQLETPDAIRGRVSAVNSVFIGASNELGEFESGMTAAWLGLVPALVVGGVATLLVTFLWARVWFPVLWRMQSFDELKDAAQKRPVASG